MTLLLFQALILLCLIHVLYEWQILPVLLLKKRYRLFELRDHLREYEAQNGGHPNQKVLQYMHGSINVAIYLLEFFDAAFLYKTHRMVKNDKVLQIGIEKNAELFERYATAELRAMRQEVFQILNEAFILHSVMLAVYVIPFACILLLKNTIKEQIKRVTDIPENNVYGMHPSRVPATARCE